LFISQEQLNAKQAVLLRGQQASGDKSNGLAAISARASGKKFLADTPKDNLDSLYYFSYSLHWQAIFIL
jgi:hypothetical protein